MRVFLIGFMGTGKSTVGRELAEILGCPLVDLDAEVEDRAGLSIAEIFGRHGEEAFRELEHEALKATLQVADAVIATGGGTASFERNRRLMGSAGVSVWLDLAFDEILNRLGPAGRRRRPLFDDEGRALSLFEQRRPFYGMADHRVILAGDESPAETARRIVACLGGDACAT